MPRDKKGEIYLNFWHGLFVWFCVFLWILAWGGIGILVSSWNESTGKWVMIIGIGSFGLVPAYFFSREEHRYPGGC